MTKKEEQEVEIVEAETPVEVKEKKPKFSLTIRLEGHKEPVVKSFESQRELDAAKVDLKSAKGVVSFS